MCGRFAQGDTEAIYKKYNVPITEELVGKIQSRYNVAPAQMVPVVVQNSSGVNRIKRMKWGLIPFWAKDPKIGYKFINARSETVATKRSFQKAFKHQRCIVPATGFYEWLSRKDEKIPYFVFPNDSKLFSMAGIYDVWSDAEGKKFVTFAILTTEASEGLSSIHDRMPVILENDEVEIWLDTSIEEPESLEILFDSFPDEKISKHAVSQEVNSTKNEGEELTESVE